MTKNAFKIAKTQIYDFISQLMQEYDVYAPVEDEVTKFKKINEPCEMKILPNRTQISSKSVFFPPREDMFLWKKEDDGYDIRDSTPKPRKKVLFGLRGCDIHALQILDRYMLGEFRDPYYEARRRETVLIGVTCEYPRDSCFCASFGGMVPDSYDLWLTDIGRYYLVEVGSERGMDLLIPSLFKEASDADIQRARRKIERIEDEMRRKVKINLCEVKKCSQEILKKAQDELWKSLADICLACGKCNFVCPTCHCFNVVDSIDMDGSSGKRIRVWDSCHLYEYARTSAENFRKERKARVKYRIYDKFVFPVMRYGIYACTGCGRCTEVCPANIDISDVLRRLIS